MNSLPRESWSLSGIYSICLLAVLSRNCEGQWEERNYWLKIKKFIIGPLSDDALIDGAFSCLEQSQKSSVVIVPAQTIAHHEWGWRKSGLGEIRFILGKLPGGHQCQTTWYSKLQNMRSPPQKIIGLLQKSQEMLLGNLNILRQDE